METFFILNDICSSSDKVGQIDEIVDSEDEASRAQGLKLDQIQDTFVVSHGEKKRFEKQC